MTQSPNPRFIFHIASMRDWIDAKQAGDYRVSTLGRKLADQGFIHASTSDQVESVANAIYRGARGLVLLVIDPRKVKPDIRYEPATPETAEARRVTSEVKSEHPAQAGQLFPHIYGPLNVDAVVEALGFESEFNGRFYFPAEIVDRL